MALDINGYNATFKSFVKFAQDNFNVGDEKAVAGAKIQKEPLKGRRIVAVTNSLMNDLCRLHSAAFELESPGPLLRQRLLHPAPRDRPDARSPGRD